MDDFYEEYMDFEGDYDLDSLSEDYGGDECGCEADSSDFENDASEKDIYDSQQEIRDEFTGRDAFYAGTLMGFAYEEALIEAKRRRLKKNKPGGDGER
jgi:hypothetical protein